MATLSAVLMPFAMSIHIKAAALKRLSLTARQKEHLRASISDDIKKCTNLVKPGMSYRAARRGRSLGLDLRASGWHDQPSFDRGRKLFHLEHFTPVAVIREECIQARSAAGVRKVLLNRFRVIWILKSENARLTRLGYATARPDPRKAYKAAGIRLVYGSLRALSEAV